MGVGQYGRMQQALPTRRSEWKFFGTLLAAAFALMSAPRPALAEPTPEQAFARAKEDLNAGRLREAAAGFRGVALKRPPSAVGESAAMLYFDAVAKLVPDDKEDSIAQEAAGTAEELIDLYCPEKRAAGREQLCEMLPRLHVDLLRFLAEGRAKAAAMSGRDGAAAALEQADSYLSIWRMYGEATKKGRPQYPRMDEILYNAGMLYRRAGRAPESITTLRLLADPANKMRSSPLSAKAVYMVGGIYVSIGEYAEGAAWFERFARESAKEDAAPGALREAVGLRLALGQYREADAAADLFSKNYGTKKTADAAELAFATGVARAESGDFKGAEERLKASLPMIETSGNLSDRIQARAALARSLAARGDARGAEEQYRSVRMIFKNPQDVAERIVRMEPWPAERRLGKALTALGEAHFYFAEREREKASALKLPPYRGPADREALKNGLAEAIRRRSRAIEEAEAAYTQILNIQPMPPPKWVIAGAAQVAGMWADLTAELRALAAAAKKEGAASKALAESIDQMLAPIFPKALGAARTCDSYATKFLYTSEDSSRCQAWLIENAPRQYPKIEEIAPRIGYIRQGATELEAPLLRPGDAPSKDPNDP